MDWRFWRWFRRQASHSNAEGMPASVIRADKRSARFSIAETCFGILVVAGVLYEDWDNLPMVVHPNSPAGRMAIGGIIVAFGIVAEVWASSRSSKAEHEVRDWYASRVAELNLLAEQEHAARVNVELELSKVKEKQADRTITGAQQEQIVLELLPFAGVSVDVFRYEHTYEISQMATLIGDLATRAKWIAREWFVFSALVAIRGILVVSVASDDFPNVHEAADTIASALAAGGIATLRLRLLDPHGGNGILPPGAKVTLLSGTYLTGINAAPSAPLLIAVGAKP
jgi:hypothetical protein